MADYIDRADWIETKHIETSPPKVADMVEVVRCKDCEYSYNSVAGLVCSRDVCVERIVDDILFSEKECVEYGGENNV